MSSDNSIFPIKGIRLSAAKAGIKKKSGNDLLLIEVCEGTALSAVFTQNVFCAAPVTIARQHLKHATPRYLLINSGNANAGLGAQGISAAMRTCEAVATVTKVHASQILPFSTGVIGEPLPDEKITQTIPELFQSLHENSWHDAALAIMTTDTQPKIISQKCEIDGAMVTVTGIAKGAGMIHPNMATMLSFIATDALIDKRVLTELLTDCVNASFNRISVDGDTSTNDACVLMATAKASMKKISDAKSSAAMILKNTLQSVFQYLAKAIIKDAEGATKFVTIRVDEGKTCEECLAVANAIATSPLVKTALFASDPNWGRILAAVGRAPVIDLDPQKISIFLGDVEVVNQGSRAVGYTEADGARLFAKPEITINVKLGRGGASETIWTNDFSYDYVKINAEYRT